MVQRSLESIVPYRKYNLAGVLLQQRHVLIGQSLSLLWHVVPVWLSVMTVRMVPEGVRYSLLLILSGPKRVLRERSFFFVLDPKIILMSLDMKKPWVTL